MAETKQTRGGGCLCGAIRFKADGPPKWTGWCHCRSCRKHTGAPVSAYAGYEGDRVRFEAEPAKFASSPGVLRGFCPTCGSTLTYEGERWPGEIHLHVGAFDQPQDFPPREESSPEERLPWVHVTVEDQAATSRRSPSEAHSSLARAGEHPQDTANC